MELLSAKPESVIAAIVIAIAWIIGKSIESAIRYWRSRLPLKRAGDEHNQKMALYLRDISQQQERTAMAVEKVAAGVADVQGDMRVLIDRSK